MKLSTETLKTIKETNEVIHRMTELHNMLRKQIEHDTNNALSMCEPYYSMQLYDNMRLPQEDVKKLLQELSDDGKLEQAWTDNDFDCLKLTIHGIQFKILISKKDRVIVPQNNGGEVNAEANAV